MIYRSLGHDKPDNIIHNQGDGRMPKRKKSILVPEAQKAVDQLKVRVMKQEGYQVDSSRPDDVKYEVAKEIQVPLKEGYNGTLTSTEAGKVGGQIGGKMVKEMIRMAQQSLGKK